MTKPKNTTVVAGIAGVVIGAGVTAAAAAMTDKRTREKVLSTISNVKNHASDMIEQSHTATDEAKHGLDEMIDDGKKTVYKAKEEGEAIAKSL